MKSAQALPEPRQADDFSSDAMANTGLELISIIIPAVFSVFAWVTVFMETYRHFPKMDKTKRIWMSVQSATLLAVILIVLGFLFMQFIVIRGLTQ